MESRKAHRSRCFAGHFTGHLLNNETTGSRAALLLYQLQDLSEKERRARNHNQKLLQDFQRAQNTLSDLVAHTETMNTIRMEYSRLLQENYPKWQQNLQDKRLSEEQMMIEQHLKTCTLQTEKESHPFRINAPSAIYPNPSHCAIFNSLSHTSDHRGNMAEVNVSAYYGNTSGSSDMLSEAARSLPTKDQRMKNERRKERKQTQKSRKEAVSQRSSSVSDSQSVLNHKKQKRYERSNGAKTVFKTSEVAVGSTKQLVNENHGNSNQIVGKLTNISCMVRNGGMNRYDDETEEVEYILSPGQMQINKVENRDSTENQDNCASLSEKQDKKEEAEERSGEQSSTDEDETLEEEPLRSNKHVKNSLLEEVDFVRESEAEEGQAEEEEEKDGKEGDEIKKSRAPGRGSKGDNNDQKENYSEALAACSERNIQDSLRELYKDDTEEEKEANIDEELEEENDDEDCDDDDVIIEKSSPWTCHPVVEDSKSQNDDDDDDDDDDDYYDVEDDDIEGLLAPQNSSLKH